MDFKAGDTGMKKHETYFWIFLPVLLLVAGSVLAAPKNVTECGTVLTEPGNYKLVNDLLDCPGNGVDIVGSDIVLNLKGYEISCAENDLEVSGVAVYSLSEAMISNVTVKNGTISNCRDGIVVIQTEDSKVMNITSTGNTMWEREPGVWVYGTGITLWMSRNNVIMNNHTYGNATEGIGSWESSGNLFKHNTSTGNGNGWTGAGISLVGEYNSHIMCNRVHGNADGILLHSGGSGNLIRGNLVSDNVTGIEMLGFYWQDPDSGQEYYYGIPSGNTIRSNIAQGHPWTDLFEAYWDYGSELLLNPDGVCRNTWEKNQFETEIGLPGCIGTPVELDEEDVCALDNDDD
jgi:parallel beta-helix repeat protein